MIVACVSDELIHFGEVSAERFVWVDDSQLGSIPADLASFGVKVPFGFGDQEVVVLNFSIEVVGRDIEVSWSSIEVEMDSVAFGDSCFPRVVILVGVEGVDCISPCVFEALDLLEVFLLSQSDDKVFILDNSAISEYDFVFIGVDFVDSDVV